MPWSMQVRTRSSRCRRVFSEQIALIGETSSFRARSMPENPNASLDRTNFVQDILSRTVIEQYLSLIRREWLHIGSLWSYHRELWAENGDALSRIYAGTGALNTSYTRSGKRTLAGRPVQSGALQRDADRVGFRRAF